MERYNSRKYSGDEGGEFNTFDLDNYLNMFNRELYLEDLDTYCGDYLYYNDQCDIPWVGGPMGWYPLSCNVFERSFIIEVVNKV